MADYLVGCGVPFRKAHEVVGKAVAYALGKAKELHELSLKELQKFSPVIQEEIFQHLTLEHMISRRLSAGGTSQENVKAAIAVAVKELSNQDGVKTDQSK
jgi:argininosuccinate lyase